MLEKRPEFGMKNGVEAVSASLLPRLVEAAETERPVSLPDPAGGDVEFSHDLGGPCCALLRNRGAGDGVLLNAPQRPPATVPRRPQELLDRSLVGGARREGILHLASAPRDFDH